MQRNDNVNSVNNVNNTQIDQPEEICIYPGRVYTHLYAHLVLTASSFCSAMGLLVFLPGTLLYWPKPNEPQDNTSTFYTFAALAGAGLISSVVSGISFFQCTKKKDEVENNIQETTALTIK